MEREQSGEVPVTDEFENRFKKWNAIVSESSACLYLLRS